MRLLSAGEFNWLAAPVHVTRKTFFAHVTLICADVCRKLWYVKRSCNFPIVTRNLKRGIFSIIFDKTN